MQNGATTTLRQTNTTDMRHLRLDVDETSRVISSFWRERFFYLNKFMVTFDLLIRIKNHAEFITNFPQT
jgi:hypothetical protein